MVWYDEVSSRSAASPGSEHGWGGVVGMWALAPGPGTERRSRSRRLGELALGFYVLELSGGGKRPRDIAATGPFPF